MIKLNRKIIIAGASSLAIALLIPSGMFPPLVNLFLGTCSLTLGAITLKEVLKAGGENDN